MARSSRDPRGQGGGHLGGKEGRSKGTYGQEITVGGGRAVSKVEAEPGSAALER